MKKSKKLVITVPVSPNPLIRAGQGRTAAQRWKDIRALDTRLQRMVFHNVEAEKRAVLIVDFVVVGMRDLEGPLKGGWEGPVHLELRERARKLAIGSKMDPKKGKLVRTVMNLVLRAYDMEPHKVFAAARQADVRAKPESVTSRRR